MTVVDALILNPKVTQSLALLATTLGRDKASFPAIPGRSHAGRRTPLRTRFHPRFH